MRDKIILNIESKNFKKIPENINKIIYEFITGVNDILGDRVKKIILYYMDLMLEVILIKIMCNQVIYFVKVNKKQPTYTHKLIRLAEECNLYKLMSEEQKEFIFTVTPLNIETRYPTQKKDIFESLSEEKIYDVYKKKGDTVNMNNKTNVDKDEQFYKEINSEESCLWYKKNIGLKETQLIIKTFTPCIKALIAGCPLKLIFGKKEDYLCIGVRIFDIPDGAMFISKVQYKSEEHKALINALQEGTMSISLINEMNVLLDWSKIKISKEKVTDILKWVDKERLYIGTHTKEVDYAHNCFCISVENTCKDKYPHADIIPVREVETIVDNWNVINIYFYGNQDNYQFIINNTDEGNTFETQIASSLVSVFPSSLYKNPQIKKSNTMRELTDILAFYEYGSFLIEIKVSEMIKNGFLINKERRILTTQKHIKKAIKQMTGAVKKFKAGEKIYTIDHEEIEVDRTQTPQCIILIPEFIHEGNWKEIEDLLFCAIEETGAIFNIMDFAEFIELLKASSGNPKIIDYNLMQREKWLIQHHSIHIKGTIKL